MVTFATDTPSAAGCMPPESVYEATSRFLDGPEQRHDDGQMRRLMSDTGEARRRAVGAA